MAEQIKIAATEEGKSIAGEGAKKESAGLSPTIREVFALPEKDTDPRSAEWKTFQERIKKEVKSVKWSAMPDLAQKVCELLEISIPNILVTAWKKAKELQAALEKSRNTPDEVTYLELAEHTINSDHKPSIDVRLKGATLKKIELPVQLGFKLKGFVLKIQNGGIRELRTGHCEVKGTVKYHDLTIAEKKLEAIKLPFSIPIPESIGMLMTTAPTTQVAQKNAPEQIERIEI